MSSGQNKREQNKMAVRKHRDAKRTKDEERRAEIQKLREENMRLERNIHALRAEEKLFKSIVDAHDLASGGQFSRTLEDSQIIDNISDFMTVPGEREQQRREEGR